MPDSKSDSYRMTIRIRLDESSVRILNIFQKYPNREFKVSMLITILEYEGIEIGYKFMSKKAPIFREEMNCDKYFKKNGISYLIDGNK